ncbi:MAG: hypothetical protein BIP78_1186 [Candidatus Bipolaricaulis sibiricus]|uniref:PKD domain-containing protein n=1 Tax=Bipolaricaulis sibiricus TaxID=2501609 RepID=A0A410FVF1_BIPS1|nr:MAG: hypothetical protein BIP78_1186 [Candidatus Bipolaricaulis sibiricus]
MRWGWTIGVALVAVVGAGTPGDIYQWTYDQLALGPGWTGHVFANRTGGDVLGLELLFMDPGQAQVLVVGGRLTRDDGGVAGVRFAGRIVPGGVVTVALPTDTMPHQALWITSAGLVPIDLDLPIPRLSVEEIWPELIISTAGEDGQDDGTDEFWGSKELSPGWDEGSDEGGELSKGGGVTVLGFSWPHDLDPELLRDWQGYVWLVRLDGRRSFSPLGEEIISWKWFWEDGLGQQGPVVVRGFASPGAYRVRLVVTDGAGREQILTRFVEARDWAAIAEVLGDHGTTTPVVKEPPPGIPEAQEERTKDPKTLN